MTEPVGDLNVVSNTENKENGAMKYMLLLGSNLKIRVREKISSAWYFYLVGMWNGKTKSYLKI